MIVNALIRFTPDILARLADEEYIQFPTSNIHVIQCQFLLA